jgi:hypothetical protein
MGLSVALVAASALVGAAIRAPAPLAFEAVPDEIYAEQVGLVVDLADGAYLAMQFGVSNVGPGDGKGVCRFTLVDRSGAVVQGERIVERHQWRYDAASQTLHMGACKATSDGALVMRAELAEGTIEARLASVPKRTRVMATTSGSDFYELDTLVLWSDAVVEIAIGDEKRTVKGRGYADHSRSKILPNKLAKQWLRFRGLDSADPRVLVVRIPPSGPVDGWHHAGSFGRSTVTRAQLQKAEKGGWRALVEGDRGQWRLTTTTLLDRFAPVEERGPVLGSVIGALVGNPVTYTFRGVLEERGTKRRIHGIVEVTLTNE